MAENNNNEASSNSPATPPEAERPILPGWLEVPKDDFQNPYRVSEPVDSLSSAQKSGSVSLLMVALIVVAVGLIMAVPGLGILVAILIVPPLVRTIVVAKHRSAQQRPPTTSEQVLLFIGSFGVTLVISMVVLVSAFGTFCAVCLSAGTEDAIPVALLAAGVTTIPVSIPLFFWIRSRWHRHTQST